MQQDPSSAPPPAGESAASNGAAPSAPSQRAERAVARAREIAGRVARDAATSLGPTTETVRHDLSDAFGHLRRQRHLGSLVAGAVLALYLLSGTFVVTPGHEAVVTRFGGVVRARVAPGLGWRIPWPFEATRVVNVAQVRREGIGVSVPGHPEVLHPTEDIQLLTGDENLLTAKAIVQYRIKSPADYLFRIDFNEDPLLRNVVRAALTELAGGVQVDALLTSGRTALQQQARERAQARLDTYRSGLELVSIDLQEIVPPGDVAQAFRNVSSAAEEKNKLINDAQGYANSVIPQARGEAQRRAREAEGYRADVVNRARGEAQRFSDVFAQYRRDSQIFGPEVTRYRLYVETMEKVLPRARKYVVEPGQRGDSVNLRILDQLPPFVAPASQPAARP